jgi:hypothetical protein
MVSAFTRASDPSTLSRFAFCAQHVNAEHRTHTTKQQHAPNDTRNCTYSSRASEDIADLDQPLELLTNVQQVRCNQSDLITELHVPLQGTNDQQSSSLRRVPFEAAGY